MSLCFQEKDSRRQKILRLLGGGTAMARLGAHGEAAIYF